MKLVVPEIYVKDCLQALDFYKDLFGGEIKNLQISDNMEMFKQYKNKVVHAELHVSRYCIFYFLDVLDPKRARVGNVTLMLHLHTRQELQQIYEGLCRGGTVGMELQKTFWGEYHAIVTDRFGAPWSLNYAPKKRAARPS